MVAGVSVVEWQRSVQAVLEDEPLRLANESDLGSKDKRGLKDLILRVLIKQLGKSVMPFTKKEKTKDKKTCLYWCDERKIKNSV
jgi:hypothetical protein